MLAVSFLSLGLRTGLIVALSIPLTLAVTFLFMYQAGIDLHKISLGALIIALGPAGRRRHHLGGDDGGEDGAGLRARAGGELRLHLDRDADAHRHRSSPPRASCPSALARSSTGEYTFSIFAVTTIALLVSWVVSVLFVPYLGYKLLPDFRKAGAHVDEGAVYRKPFYLRFRRW